MSQKKEGLGFTQGGGGCRQLLGWRVFDGFESYAGKQFEDFGE